jgi:hypothetical protein
MMEQGVLPPGYSVGGFSRNNSGMYKLPFSTMRYSRGTGGKNSCGNKWQKLNAFWRRRGRVKKK